MKNQNRVRRKGGSKTASAQAHSQSATQVRQGLKTYRVFTAAAGETDMTKWREGERVQARSPLDAARRHLREFKRLALCRFNQGDTDYLFDLVKGTGATPASEGEGMTVVFLGHDADEHFADVFFTAAEFAGIKEAAREMNLTLPEFCTRAVAERLQRARSADERRAA